MGSLPDRVNRRMRLLPLLVVDGPGVDSDSSKLRVRNSDSDVLRRGEPDQDRSREKKREAPFRRVAELADSRDNVGCSSDRRSVAPSPTSAASSGSAVSFSSASFMGSCASLAFVNPSAWTPGGCMSIRAERLIQNDVGRWSVPRARIRTSSSCKSTYKKRGRYENDDSQWKGRTASSYPDLCREMREVSLHSAWTGCLAEPHNIEYEYEFTNFKS